jgi:hypothetical protein
MNKGKDTDDLVQKKWPFAEFCISRQPWFPGNCEEKTKHDASGCVTSKGVH